MSSKNHSGFLKVLHLRCAPVNRYVTEYWTNASFTLTSIKKEIFKPDNGKRFVYSGNRTLNAQSLC